MLNSTWKKVLNDLGDMDFQGRIGLHLNNEPLLDIRLPAIIRYAKKINPQWNLFIATNGDLLTEHKYCSLMSAGLDRILFTDYGGLRKYKRRTKVVYRKHTDMKMKNRAGTIYSKNKLIEKPCLRSQKQLAINWEGNVILCCCDFYGEKSFGNVKEQSIAEVWNDSPFKKVRAKLAERRDSIKFCRYCDM